MSEKPVRNGRVFLFEGEYMEREYTNVMEEIVVTWVQVLMSGMEYQTFCSCRKCKNDIITLSLNNLPNYYVTTEGGKGYLEI